MLRCKRDKLLLGILFFISLGEIIIGGYEIALYFRYNEVQLSDSCSYISIILFGAYINDLFAGFSSLLYFTLTLCFQQSIKKELEAIASLHSLKIFYLIMLILFYNEVISCHSQIIEYSPEIWNILLLHIICGLFLFIIFVVVLIVLGITSLYNKNRDPRPSYGEIELK
jgi:uncharacterized membrane protein